jgi:uncharacterized protein (TIGR03437 family)
MQLVKGGLVMLRKLLLCTVWVSLLLTPIFAQTQTNWLMTGKTTASNTDSVHYLYADSSLLITAYFGSAFRSTDQGKTWEKLTIPNGLNAVARINNKLVGAFGHVGFYVSTDQGVTWVKSNKGLEQWGGAIDAVSLLVVGTMIYAGAGEFAGSPRLVRSTDEGTTWSRFDTGLESIKRIVGVVSIGATLLALEINGKLFRSTGGNWSPTGTTVYEPSLNPTLVASKTNFFVAGRKGIFRSDAQGQTWTKILDKYIDVYAAAIPNSNIAVRGQTVLAIVRDTCCPSVDLWASKDNGQTWTKTLAHKAQDNSGVDFYALAFGSNKAYMVTGLNAYANDKILPPALTTASAASFKPDALAAEAIAAAFGTGLATAMQTANTRPLPTELGGTRVKVKDSAGTERVTPLFFVSSRQINFQIPPGTMAGLATISVELNNVLIAEGELPIAAVAPGLFTANASGGGYPAAVLFRIKSNGAQSTEPVVTFDTAQNKFVAVPIDLGPETDQVFLILFGTGVRGRSALTRVIVTINGVSADVTFAGAQGALIGLDQANVRIPRSLKGVNRDVDVVLSVDGVVANTVKINIK